MSNRKLWLLSSSGTLDSILHDKGHKTISVYNFLILHLKCLSDPGPKSKLTQATVHPDSTINNIQITETQISIRVHLVGQLTNIEPTEHTDQDKPARLTIG